MVWLLLDGSPQLIAVASLKPFEALEDFAARTPISTANRCGLVEAKSIMGGCWARILRSPQLIAVASLKRVGRR